MILGAAPIEGRLSGVVDIPNSCSTVYIPTGIFDFDVKPGKNGPAPGRPGHGSADVERLSSGSPGGYPDRDPRSG